MKYPSLLFFVLISHLCLSQVTVKGKVVDSDGLPISGVNVLEKGSTVGTLTSSDGEFSVSVATDASLLFQFVGYKAKEVRVNGAIYLEVTLKEEVISDWSIVKIGYGSIASNKTSGAVAVVNQEDFNRGNIYNPNQLWQGRVAGLSMYALDGNPHASYYSRIRGLTTLDPSLTPLIVIDGVPMATLNNLDPQDVESVTVLKDGASTAIYGMRGSQGVILITTKRGLPSRGLAVEYKSELAQSVMQRKQPVMSAQEHIAAGGNDLQSSTDWQDEVTRNVISGNHHLSISGSNQTSSFRVAAHVRNQNGILLNSGFDQFNVRANVRHCVIDNRLRFNFNMAVTNRKNNFSFPEAFRYANLFLPSAPIYHPNGDYYQAILFDNYNPVAILKQNINEGRSRSMNYGASLDFELLKDLIVTIDVAQQFESEFNGKYYSRNSLYVGLNRGGLAQRYTEDRSFTMTNAYLSYVKELDKLKIKLATGYAVQVDRSENFGAQLGNFPSDELGYNSLSYSADIISGLPSLIDIYSTSSPNNKISAGFLQASLLFKEVLTFNASLRRESSTKLGSNANTGWFPAVGVNLNLLSFLSQTNINQFTTRVSYGITGSVPSQYNLALDVYDYSFNGGGTVYKIQDANPDLTWEKKKEFNIGIDYVSGRFNGTIEFYNRAISDIIQRRFVNFSEFPSGIRYENGAALKGNGVELTLGYRFGNGDGVSWSPSIVLSSSSTKVDQYPGGKEVRGYADAPTGGSTLMIRTAEGSKVGDMWGPVFSEVAGNGAPIFKDTNGDGQIVANSGSALDPLTDFTSLGNAFPTLELGWGNIINYKRLSLNTFFRAAFGHSLINILRLGYESLDPGAINSFNRVKTDKEVDGITFGQYSSLYVERADFFKLDNITLMYTWPFKEGKWISNIKFYGTIQNAFVITNYTGVNPEPRFVDFLPTNNNYIVNQDLLAPGIDRNAGYYPSRTMLVGISIGI